LYLLLIVSEVLFFANPDLTRELYKVTSGYVSFESLAPLETIRASTSEVNGIIDAENRKFAFSIPIASFIGFNSPLQRTHFNENYMESNRFANATFTGKIVEKINFAENGTYEIRSKGTLDIHGIKQERIIKSVLIIEDGKLIAKSIFTILLKEHGITIPKIVHQKIAKEILVSVDVVFEKE